MIIQKASPITGELNSMEIDVTLQQINDWQRGALIQDVMPDLTVDEREFMISGMTPEEWTSVFGTDEEE